MTFRMKQNISSSDSLKQRVMMAKTKIRQKMPIYMKAFLAMYPEYDSREGVQSIRNTINLVRADLVITEKLEAFAQSL